MKIRSTLFLRFVLFIICLAVIALCIFALPSIWKGGSKEFPDASYAIFLIVIGLYLTVIPFFVAIWQVFKLLNYIDQNKVFSNVSLEALGKIKKSVIIISVLYIGGVPLLFPIAQADDAPGLIIFGALIAGIPVTVAVFVNVLQKLLQSAIDMKSEKVEKF